MIPYSVFLAKFTQIISLNLPCFLFCFFLLQINLIPASSVIFDTGSSSGALNYIGDVSDLTQMLFTVNVVSDASVYIGASVDTGSKVLFVMLKTI